MFDIAISLGFRFATLPSTDYFSGGEMSFPFLSGQSVAVGRNSTSAISIDVNRRDALPDLQETLQ